MHRPLKITRFARGYVVGKVYTDLAPGIAQTLVDCGRAQWVEAPAIPQPELAEVASVTSDPVQSRRESRRR